MPPRLLAFDTATEQFALALVAGGRTLGVVEPGGANTSARMLPAIRALLSEAGLSLGELDAIAFGRGPGAFTGLRSSCAVAQGLAFGAGKPVLPIDSLLIVAEDARVQRPDPAAPCDCLVAMDARMQEIYSAAYRWDGQRWQVLAEASLDTAAAWVERCRNAPAQLLAGSAVTLHGLQDAVPQARAVTQEADRAAALARLAQAAWADGGGLDAAQALPLYVRDKVAQTTREREAARLAREGAAT